MVAAPRYHAMLSLPGTRASVLAELLSVGASRMLVDGADVRQLLVANATDHATRRIKEETLPAAAK
jgi:hypothetical protein